MLTSENPRKITVSEMAPHVHNFMAGENKVEKLVKWLARWITISLENHKIEVGDFLPSKGDIACHIGVSLGTMQTVFRRLEDMGLVQSKQKIGTFISNLEENRPIEKLTSKKDLTVEILKRYIIDNNYIIGSKIPSSRKLAEIFGLSNTTIRHAIISLVNEKILVKDNKSFIVIKNNFNIEKIETKTLVEKIAEKIKLYIDKNLTTKEKLPSNSELTKMFGVSIKTIHDSLKLLAKDGIVYTRRGQYGTIVINNKIQTELYDYEKVEQKIRNYIIQNTQVGDKLPSIKEFSINLGTSEKTVKKALDLLSEDGFVMFTRGRYGGTFVTDIPQSSSEAYKWLALSSNYTTDSNN